MNTKRRSSKFIALAAATSVVLAACGSDDDDSGDDEEPASTEAEAEEPEEEPEEEAPAEEPEEESDDAMEEDEESDDAMEEDDEAMEDEEPAADAAMILTVDLNPDAVWEDGTPITVADLECTYLANLNTPASLSTTGFDQIISVEEGESEKQAVISFATVYAPYKTLFNPILKADRHDDCNDVSLDFEDAPPDSARPFRFETWSPDQSILVANENYWGDAPAAPQITMVPFADQDTEKAAIASGEVDFISPQYDPGFQAVAEDASVDLDLQFGANYEGFYFQQSTDPQHIGPFANDVYREAFWKSIDRESAFVQIYVPIGGEDAPLLNCGPITPGPYCPDNETAPFADSYDPEGAVALLEENGWTQNGDGFWVDPDTGEVPQVRWIINTGNTRRESMQAYLIPLLAEAGFDVVPDNCDAACYFQQRLPALDYDMAMYISTAPPDPSYLTASFTCDQIPTEANDYVGQNSGGWCNEQASSNFLAADETVDEAERVTLITEALQLMADDHHMLPLFQFPASNLWRNDKVGPAEIMAQDTINYMSFARSLQGMEDLDGDGQVVIGAEQWPECLNPITECANSSWYVWTVSFAVMPGLWDTTNDQTFVTTDLVVGEPTVETL